ASALLGFKQGLVRLPGRNIVGDQRGPIAQGLRGRSVSLDCHKISSYLPALSFFLPLHSSGLAKANDRRPTTVLKILRVLRHFFSGFQPYVRLFPIGPITSEFSSPPLFAGVQSGAHRVHFYFEN